jgi:hypothetical protein
VVSNATAVLSRAAGPDLQKYAGDLSRVEQSSRVTRAQFAHLASDATALAEAIESSLTLEPSAVTQQLDELQDTIDAAFLATNARAGAWNQLQQEMASALYGTTLTSPQLPQQTFAQMRVVARAAHVSPADHQELVADEKAIAADMGPNVNANLGGAGPRDPLVVYYDGQVAGFVHQR